LVAAREARGARRGSNYHSRARTGEGGASLYDEITDKIIAEFEAGRVPWVQPWGTVIRTLRAWGKPAVAPENFIQVDSRDEGES